jgi:hypothetical protein
MAVGLSGRIEVADRNTQMTFGTPGPEATIIAAVNNNRREAASFFYLAGAKLVRNGNNGAQAQTARNRRCGFFLRENGLNDLRKAGEDLFEAAINFCWSGDMGSTTAPGSAAAPGAVY